MKEPDFIIVAIDGGAAAGKSSTADALSERFHLLHVDTGSFYRAVTAELLRRGVRPDDLPAVRSALAGLKLGTHITGRRAEIELDHRVHRAVAAAVGLRQSRGSDRCDIGHPQDVNGWYRLTPPP